MRLWITRPMTDDVEARARAEFDVDIRQSHTPLTKDEMVTALTDYDLVIPTLGDVFSAQVFAQVGSPRCRLLANFGVGYNHIDVQEARAAGLDVSNTPGAVTDATADIALTLILMSARRAAEGERLVRSGGWDGWHPTQMLGLHVTGKTVGIVGMGRIGQAIAQRCHLGFGMTVKYFNRSPKDLPFAAEKVGSLADLAESVDFLVLAVPGGVETRHLINPSILAQMKRSAFLINISRGDVIDESALIQALTQGQIAGAGLDVYENEPLVPRGLRELNTVTLLPHLGTAAQEVRSNMGHMALDNVAAQLAGKPLPNAV